MKILGIEHIGIAVKNIKDTSCFWNDILGIEFTGQESVLDQKVETSIYNTGSGKIELLEPLSDDSVIKKFLDRKGEGVHHICLTVDNIFSAIAEIKEKGVSVVYPEPRKGAEGYLVTFIHPKHSGGVLVELAQKPQ